MNESEIIELFYRPGAAVRLDDCARIDGTDGQAMLATTDCLAEGTHFRLEWSAPEDLAIKLFQCNLSDLGSSGARARSGLLNLGLPAEHNPEFAKRFARELNKQFEENHCRLLGGDTFRSRAMVLNLTLFGSAPRVLTREGGRVGDSLFVTGSLGLSLAGLRLLLARDGVDEFDIANRHLRDAALEKHLRPQARAPWGWSLAANERVHAAMDVSDGIAQDGPRLARASELLLEIDMAALPLHPGLEEYMTVDDAVQSGEEFELLFLASPDFKAGFPCTRIGRALEADGSGDVRWLRSGREQTLPAGGFRHF